jgi:hypothetical protein
LAVHHHRNAQIRAIFNEEGELSAAIKEGYLSLCRRR